MPTLPLYRNIHNQYIIQPNGCWLWIRATNPYGYGFLKINRRTIMAHRFVFEIIKKRKIKDNYDLDHLCRNRWCVNPEHLEEVIHQENMRRGKRTQMTIEQVKEIKQKLQKGEKHRDIARIYKVKKSIIDDISASRAWKDV